MRFKLSNHAREEMEHRKIPFPLLESVLENPQQVVSEVGGEKVYQSQVNFDNSKTFFVASNCG